MEIVIQNLFLQKDYRNLSQLSSCNKYYYNMIIEFLKKNKPLCYGLPIKQQYISKWCGDFTIDPEYIYSNEFLENYNIHLDTLEKIIDYNMYLIKRTSEGCKTTYIDRIKLNNKTIFVIDVRGIIRRLPSNSGSGILVEVGDKLLKKCHNGMWGKNYKFQFEIEGKVLHSEEIIEGLTKKYT